MAKIFVFWDSIAEWYRDSQWWWFYRLRNFSLKQKIYWPLVDLSIWWDDTLNILDRFERELLPRLFDYRWDKLVLMFSVWINDSRVYTGTDTHQVNPEDFLLNLEKILNIAKKYTHNVVFLWVLPVDDSKLNPIPRHPEVSYQDRYAKMYNDIIQDFCKENNLDFIELYDTFKKLDYKAMMEDWVHPEDPWHEIIFEKVKNYLLRKNFIGD